MRTEPKFRTRLARIENDILTVARLHGITYEDALEHVREQHRRIEKLSYNYRPEPKRRVK